MKIKSIALLILIVFSSLGFRGCGGNDGVWRGSYSTKNSAKTAKQVTVFSANKINQSLFPNIDRGIDQLAETAILEGYQPLTHPEFRVALFPRSPKCINPGFLVAADGLPLWPDGWDNHPDFDKDPRVGKVLLCAAGLHPGANVMVVADDPGHMATIVQYEGEHITLLFRDPARWNETSGVHAHPIFRQQEGALAEAAFAPWTAITVEIAKDIEADGLTVKKGSHICVLLVK